jgi:hypothetical protein
LMLNYGEKKYKNTQPTCSIKMEIQHIHMHSFLSQYHWCMFLSYHSLIQIIFTKLLTSDSSLWAYK